VLLHALNDVVEFSRTHGRLSGRVHAAGAALKGRRSRAGDNLEEIPELRVQRQAPVARPSRRRRHSIRRVLQSPTRCGLPSPSRLAAAPSSTAAARLLSPSILSR
jgi:hypothetical protein